MAVAKPDQGGSILLLVSLLILAILAMAALVIDSSRERVLVGELQRVADATAHAAVISFNSDPSLAGWKNSKKAAIALLKNTSITGFSFSAEDLKPAGDSKTFYDDDGYDSTTFEADDDLQITIERGQYGNVAADTSGFTSFEGQEYFYSLRPYFIANAVRITIDHHGFTAMLAESLGWKSANEHIKSSIAVSDINYEECVAPFAISACELFRKMDDVEQTHPLNEPKASQQCGREVLFSNTHFHWPKFEDGRTRFGLHSKPIVVNQPIEGAQQPTPSIWGGMGYFDTQPINASYYTGFDPPITKLIEVLNSPSGCVKRKIGDYFYPYLGNRLRGGTWPAQPGQSACYARASDEDFMAKQVSDLLQSRINSGSDTVSTSMTGISRPELSTKPWPYVTSTSPFDFAWIGGQGGMTNPMCHDSSRMEPITDSSKVWSVVIPVVAPENKGFRYCEYNHFDAPDDGTESGTTDMFGTSLPKIVGFVRVHIFDFNFQLLCDYRNPASCPPGALQVEDQNPAAFPFGSNINAPSNASASDIAWVASHSVSGAAPVKTSCGVCSSSFCGAHPEEECVSAAGVPNPEVKCLASNGLEWAYDLGSLGVNPIRRTEPEWGCRGVRARIECNDKRIPNGATYDKPVPGIVQ